MDVYSTKFNPHLYHLVPTEYLRNLSIGQIKQYY